MDMNVLYKENGIVPTAIQYCKTGVIYAVKKLHCESVSDTIAVYSTSDLEENRITVICPIGGNEQDRIFVGRRGIRNTKYEYPENWFGRYLNPSEYSKVVRGGELS